VNARTLIAATHRSTAEVDVALAGLDRRRARVLRAERHETAHDALHRWVGTSAVRGAAAGAVVSAVLTIALALVLGLDLGPAAGVGLGVGLTGGPFLGSLFGFSLALRTTERVVAALGTDAARRDTFVVYGRALAPVTVGGAGRRHAG
jgi:hypothetical protein